MTMVNKSNVISSNVAELICRIIITVIAIITILMVMILTGRHFISALFLFF